MISRISYLLVVLFLFSCSEKPREEATSEVDTVVNHETISKKVFEFIKRRYPHEFKTHLNHQHGEDHVHFEADPDLDDHLIGNLGCYPILATGELYEIDLDNDDNNEYVCLLGLTPGLSWTQHILLLNESGQIIDSVDINTREGVCHMTFEHLQDPDQYNLLCEWQQNMSIDDNTGLFIYSYSGNKLNRILNQKLHWKVSEKRDVGPKNPSNIKEVNNTIKLIDQDNDGVKELEIYSKYILRNDTDSSSHHVLVWDGNSFIQQ